MKVRINKYLALCGLSSRRKVEEYIIDRRVKVNGKTITDLSYLVDSEEDYVEVDGKIVNPEQDFYYIILNKPKGYITSVSDDLRRPIVMDLLPDKYHKANIFPVGRLDKDSEGLLLLTNDGMLAYSLTHPKFEVPKEYYVDLNRPLEESDKQSIEKGIFLYGSRTNPSFIEYLDKSRKKVHIIITEGKKRHIRLSFAKVYYTVRKLKRIKFGPVSLGKLRSGQFRLLNAREIKTLKDFVKV